MRGLLAALMLLAATAHASPPDASRRAKEAFLEGTSLFNLGKFDKAIEKWESGYQAKPDPIFLYNIAQAYRLKGDLENALFFYRNFLRNAPQAPNRDEVDEKILKLEAAIEAEKQTRLSPPDEALPPTTVTGKKPKPAPSPQDQTQTTPSAPTTPTTPTPQTTPTAQTTPPTQPPQSIAASRTERPSYSADLAIAGGVHVWALGLPGGVDPAFGFTVGGGYDAFRRGRIALRVGVKLGYSFVSDVTSTVSLISLLAEPMLRVAVFRDRVHAFVAIGVGALLLDGVGRGSGFLASHATATGVLGAFELRPSLGIEYRPIERLAIFVAPELVYSPSPDAAFLDGALLRFAVSLGAAIRL